MNKKICRYSIDYEYLPIMMTRGTNKNLIFESETEMLEKLIELKLDFQAKDIKVEVVEFEEISRKKYEI